MSSLIINFPDCAELDTQENQGNDTQHDTITVFVENCPMPPAGPPPLVPWWAWTLGAVLVLAFIVSTAMVRFRAHERKELDRANELEAQVELAKNHKSCDYCGNNYKPNVKDKT